MELGTPENIHSDQDLPLRASMIPSPVLPYTSLCLALIQPIPLHHSVPVLFTALLSVPIRPFYSDLISHFTFLFMASGSRFTSIPLAALLSASILLTFHRPIFRFHTVPSPFPFRSVSFSLLFRLIPFRFCSRSSLRSTLCPFSAPLAFPLRPVPAPASAALCFNIHCAVGAL